MSLYQCAAQEFLSSEPLNCFQADSYLKHNHKRYYDRYDQHNLIRSNFPLGSPLDVESSKREKYVSSYINGRQECAVAKGNAAAAASCNAHPEKRNGSTSSSDRTLSGLRSRKEVSSATLRRLVLPSDDLLCKELLSNPRRALLISDCFEFYEAC